VSKQLAKWNSATTRESNPGPRAPIPSALTTKPFSHTFSSVQFSSFVSFCTRLYIQQAPTDSDERLHSPGCNHNINTSLLRVRTRAKRNKIQYNKATGTSRLSLSITSQNVALQTCTEVVFFVAHIHTYRNAVK